MIDPVYQHARREAIIIITAWLAATAYCCGYCYLYGYERPGFTPGAEDIDPVLGVPSWFFWGVIAPWAACAIFIFIFAGFCIADDDLGADHEAELEADIREGGPLG
jgi:hypothetical protein